VVTPAHLRAPEVILGCPLGFGVDIWSYGCLLFEFITGRPLVQLPPLEDDSDCLDDDHLIQLKEIPQPLPENLLAAWSGSSSVKITNFSTCNYYNSPSFSRNEILI
jgi:non-specific serine/threonine protein kinase